MLIVVVNASVRSQVMQDYKTYSLLLIVCPPRIVTGDERTDALSAVNI